MLKRERLQILIKEALSAQGNSANIVAVSKYIWDKYETELKRSEDLFYTWQYDIRWAANQLRKKGIMKEAESSPKGIWELLK